MNLFDFPAVKIDKKIRLIEMFAGIGAQAMALRDIGADFEHWFVCEFEPHTITSVNSNTRLYNQSGNSIVEQVLMGIFSQLNIKDVKPWNEGCLE